MSRYVYHTSLNFPREDRLKNEELLAIAHEYLQASGYTGNQYFIFRHRDADHPHLHLLVNRIAFDGSVVSDSNNYKKSEALLRQLEVKYGLTVVSQSSYKATVPGRHVGTEHGSNKAKESPGRRTTQLQGSIATGQRSTIAIEPGNYLSERAPTKSELEMVHRTGKASDKMILQEKLKYLLDGRCESVLELIQEGGQQGIYFLFNQASTGRVTGITYFHEDFKAKGQALGNRFKWAEIIKLINYEQDRDREAISQANGKTKLRYGSADAGETSITGDPAHERETDQGRSTNDYGTIASNADHYQRLQGENHGISEHAAADPGEAGESGNTDQNVADRSLEGNPDAAGMDRDNSHHNGHYTNNIHIEIADDEDETYRRRKSRRR